MLILPLLLNIALAATDPFCSALSPQNKSMADLKTGLVDPYAALCGDLRNISLGKAPEHQPICSVFWENGQAWWKKWVDERPEELNKGSADFKNPSRKQMRAQGYKLANASELKDLAHLFNEMKAATVSACCAGDSECKKLYLQTTLKFCSDSGADRDADAPDSCAGSLSAAFMGDQDGLTNAWWQKYTPSMTAEQKKQALEDIRKQTPGFQPGVLKSGSVTLSKYIQPSAPPDFYVLRHELGHACSFVQRQIAAKKGSIGEQDFPLQGYSQEYCKDRQPGPASMSIIDKVIPTAAQQAVKSCLTERIHKEVADTKDPAYVPGACFGAKVEEAMGDSFSAMTSLPEDMFETVGRLCLNAPSSTHLSGYSNLECLVKNVPGYAKRVHEGLRCAK